MEGVSLTDSPEIPDRWRFPAEATLEPGERRVVFCDPELPPSERNTGFGLSAQGETLFLVHQGRVVDSITFGPQAADWSIGRVPDADGPWQLTLPSPEAPNEPAPMGDPSRLRINEWMARPAQGEDWVELHNPEPRPVPLEGVGLADATGVPAISQLPPLSFIGVGPEGYLRLIADGASGGAHLAFRLDADGESIVLFSPEGTVIDSVQFGPQQRGVSQGRWPEDSDTVVSFPGSATPGEGNRPEPALRLRFWLRPGVAARLEWNARPGSLDRVQAAPQPTGPWETVAELTAEDDRAHWRLKEPSAPVQFWRVLELTAP